MLKRLGIARIQDLDTLVESLKLLHVHGPLKGNRLCSMSCSGGEASLMADTAIGRDVVFPELTSEQHDSVRATVHDLVSVSNPLDYHTYIWGNVEAMASVFIAMMRGHDGITIIIVDFPRDDTCDPSAWNCVIEAAKKAKKVRDKPLALVSTLSENIPEHISFELLESNIITLHGLDTGLAAISASVSNQMRVNPKPIFLSNPTGKSTLVDEYVAKKSLEKCGLNIPKTEKCLLSDAHLVSDQIGYPVVLKALGSAHKSELGEVFLNLQNQDAVKNALKKMHLLIEGKKKSEALKFLPKLNSELMKIAKTGIIKKQNASRNISRITKKIVAI